MIRAILLLSFLLVSPVMAQEAHNHGASQMCFDTVQTGSAEEDFMVNMIPHHEMAVEMAQDVLKTATDPEVRALAEAVIAAQTTEIEQMKKWIEARRK